MNNKQDQEENYASYLYTSYRAFSNGKALSSGNPIPPWNQMEDKYKDAWKAVARASVTYIPCSRNVTFKNE